MPGVRTPASRFLKVPCCPNEDFDEMDWATNIVFQHRQGNLVRSQELGYDAIGMITTNRLTDGSGVMEDRRYCPMPI